MSLKAKIEAVIYAAEEPVTLAQLAALFQAEVLEVRAARLSAEAAAREHESAQASENEAIEIVEVAATDPVTGEVEISVLEVVETAAGDEAAESAGPEREAAAAVEEEATPAPVEEPAPAEAVAEEPAQVEESATAEEAQPEPAAPTPEDEKRAARQRDREIREELRGILNELVAEYAKSDRGMEIREIAGGYRVATKPEYHDAVRGFVKSLKPPMKLSLQALETLAVIAYKQPVTAPEVGDIRGVDSGGVLGSLISRKLIATAGRKQVIGRPILYKTTKEFLLRFGLKDLNELPSIEEFEKMAGELADSDEAPRPELPFQPEEIEESAAPEEESEEAREIRAQDDAETEAAAVAAVGVSDESGDHEDLPGIEVEAEVKPTQMVDAGEAAAEVGQPGEGD
jgi:segregation and condensation protein B